MRIDLYGQPGVFCQQGDQLIQFRKAFRPQGGIIEIVINIVQPDLCGGGGGYLVQHHFIQNHQGIAGCSGPSCC